MTALPALLAEALPGVATVTREYEPFVTERGRALVALAESGQGVIISLLEQPAHPMWCWRCNEITPRTKATGYACRCRKGTR